MLKASMAMKIMENDFESMDNGLTSMEKAKTCKNVVGTSFNFSVTSNVKQPQRATSRQIPEGVPAWTMARKVDKLATRLAF